MLRVLSIVLQSENISVSILFFLHSILILPRMQLMTFCILSRLPCSSQTFVTCVQGQGLIYKVSLASILAINKPAKIRSRGLFFFSFYPATQLSPWLLRYFLHSSGTLRCWWSLLAQIKLFSCLQPPAFSPLHLKFSIPNKNTLLVTYITFSDTVTFQPKTWRHFEDLSNTNHSLSWKKFTSLQRS